MANRLLPNLIIAGVNKAGTTSLFTYLSAHPDICPSSIKEVQYFLPLRYGARELKPIEEYLQYFSHCNSTNYVMEATPGYFYGGIAVADAIKKQLGDVKIIFMLRNPVERLVSFYRFKKSMLELDQSLSLEEYVSLCESLPPGERSKRENNVYWGVEGGFYIDYLSDWLEVFRADSIKIIFFEHFKRDPLSVLMDLCQWLEIEHTRFISALDLSIENKTVNYKNEFLQKIVLLINWHGEVFWRSHPRLKRVLRKAYYAINSASYEETISDDTLVYLESIYSPSSKRLAVELYGHGYTSLPDWLSKELDVMTSYPVTA